MSQGLHHWQLHYWRLECKMLDPGGTPLQSAALLKTNAESIATRSSLNPFAQASIFPGVEKRKYMSTGIGGRIITHKRVKDWVKKWSPFEV